MFFHFSFLKSNEVKHNDRIKKAFTRLSQIQIEEDTEKRWALVQLVTNPEIQWGSSSVEFTIHPIILEKLLDFVKGYSQYDLQIAFNFRSQYTMRLYELVSRCKRSSLTFSIEKIREMFRLENRYVHTTALIEYVIDPAQKELEKSKSCYWFTYDRIKEGKAFKKVKFNIQYRPEFDKKIPQKTSISWDVDRQFLKVLNHSLGTTDDTWKPHRDLITKVQKTDYKEIKKILRNAQKAKNPIEYTINAFKNKL